MAITWALRRSALLDSRRCMSIPGLSRATTARVKDLAGPRSYATAAALVQDLKPGIQLHGFTVKRTKTVPELELIAFDLEHDKTGAEYLHVSRHDKNNVFSIGFKTNPPDDTGVPHILEHTTLCGSQRSVETHSC